MKTTQKTQSDSSETALLQRSDESRQEVSATAAVQAAEEGGWPTQLSSSSNGVLPPSPSAESLIQDINCPVTPSLGCAEINIPLYTIKHGDLEVPISISYRTSGIKVDDIAGPVGLGWTLHAGGSIVQQIRGKRDKELSSHYSAPPASSPGDIISISSYISDSEDCYADKFYYSYPGGAGSFFPHSLSSAGDGSVYKIAFNDDVITYHTDESQKHIKEFIITDPHGRNYTFSDHDFDINYRYLLTTFNGKQFSIILDKINDIKSRVAGWNISSMTSADGKNRISFTYDRLGHLLREHVLTRKVYEKPFNANDNVRFRGSSQEDALHSGICYDNAAVKTIEFNGNTVNFTYTDSPVPDTQEPLDPADSLYDPNPVRRLAEITVVNCNNELIRRIVFRNRDGEPSISRYKLNAVEFYDRDGNLYDKYAFTYNNKVRNGDLITVLTSQPPMYAQDHFGYYNGKDSNADLHFVTLYDDEADLSYKRSYDFKYAQYQSLSSIDRLSGLTTTFSYEPNRHLHPTLGNIDIGIRIQAINISDSGRPVQSTAFRYEESGTTIDFSKLDLSAFIQRKQYKNNDETDVYECLECSTHSLLPGASMESAKVFYGKVTEEVTDKKTGKCIKTEYLYDTSEWINTYVPQHFTKPSSSAAEAWKYIAIQDYVNSNPSNPSAGKNRYVGEIKGYFKERPSSFGNITQLTRYKSLEDGSFEPVEQQINTYTKYNQKEMFDGWYVKNMVTWPSIETPSSITTEGIPLKWVYIFSSFAPPSYSVNYMRGKQDCYFFPIYEDTAVYKTTLTRIKKFYGGNAKELSTLYNYNVTDTPIYEWPRKEVYDKTADPYRTISSGKLRKTTQNIDGDIYTERFLYCDDYTDPGISDMVHINDIYKVVGKETTKNGSRISAEYTRYERFIQTDSSASNHYAYLPVRTVKYLDDEIISDTKIEDYDSHFNPVCVTTPGSPRTCYVWSYKWMYPVAEIKGAGYEELKTALGGNSVIEAIGEASDHTAFITKLDYLRNSLPKALVTTFTYKPLIGVTSVTDPAGRMKTYHYDAAGRLNAIKDEDGNLLETYEYGTKHPR